MRSPIRSALLFAVLLGCSACDDRKDRHTVRALAERVLSAMARDAPEALRPIGFDVSVVDHVATRLPCVDIRFARAFMNNVARDGGPAAFAASRREAQRASMKEARAAATAAGLDWDTARIEHIAEPYMGLVCTREDRLVRFDLAFSVTDGGFGSYLFQVADCLHVDPGYRCGGEIELVHGGQ